MELVLYRNFSKKINSTKQPSGGFSVDVKLKDRTTVEAPTFLINGIDLDVNYCKWNNHFYFIDDIILNNNNIYELVCSQDLLATYKTEIGAYNCYIERSASNFDVQLYDVAIQQSEQASIFARNFATLDFYDSVGCYAIRINGLQTALSQSGLTTYIMDKSELNELMSYLYASPSTSVFGSIIDNVDKIFRGDKSDVVSFGDTTNALARAIFDPAKYIVSCKWLPLAKSEVAGAGQTVFAGQFALPMMAQTLGHLGKTYETTIPIPDNTYSDFRDITDGWTQYTLYLGGLGAVPVSAKDVVTGMKALYTIDFNTGDTQIIVSTAGDKLIGSYNCNLAVDIPVGGNAENILGTSSAIVSAVGNGIAGNVAGVAASGISAISAMASSTPSMIGSNGAISTLKAFPYVWMNKRVMGTKDIPTTVYGRPCCKNLTINTLSGFVKCGGASIDLPCLAGDRDRVNSYLNNGFYYE